MCRVLDSTNHFLCRQRSVPGRCESGTCKQDLLAAIGLQNPAAVCLDSGPVVRNSLRCVTKVL